MKDRNSIGEETYTDLHKAIRIPTAIENILVKTTKQKA